MITNIQFQFDEKALEQQIKEEIVGRAEDYCKEMAWKAIMNCGKAETKNCGASAMTGLKWIIERRIDEFLTESKEDIVEEASKILAKRTGNSKRWKEKVNDDFGVFL